MSDHQFILELKTRNDNNNSNQEEEEEEEEEEQQQQQQTFWELAIINMVSRECLP